MDGRINVVMVSAGVSTACILLLALLLLHAVQRHKSNRREEDLYLMIFTGIFELDIFVSIHTLCKNSIFSQDIVYLLLREMPQRSVSVSYSQITSVTDGCADVCFSSSDGFVKIVAISQEGGDGRGKGTTGAVQVCTFYLGRSMECTVR